MALYDPAAPAPDPVSPLIPAAGETAIVFRGPLDCARQTWAGEGLRGFYKGLSVPLLNTTIETAFMFTINQTVKRALQSPQDAAEGLPLPKIMASGAVTGA